MHFHLPKPLHGWRAFAGEVGIIVIGVLIALGAEAVVQSVNDRHVAEEARENVRAEARLDLGFIRDRINTQHCIDARLDALSAILSKAGDGALEPRPSWIGLPPTIPFFTGRWQAATASGRNSLFPPKEQEQFATLYQIFDRYNDYQPREQEVWADLRALETWQGPLGPEARVAFAKSLQQAKYLAWDLNYAGTYALRDGTDMGLSDAPVPPQLHSICLPITESRGDAARQLNDPFGEP